jgi:hypothetical protein
MTERIAQPAAAAEELVREWSNDLRPRGDGASEPNIRVVDGER